MLVFPNCKINIGLRITGKRQDGFHNLYSIFFPVPWCDALEMIEANELTLSLSGLAVPGDAANNLCLKAWHLLKKDFPNLPPVHIYLHKTIPTGAGLGGGSSNATFMLKALNEKFELGISFSDLQKYALVLGSDCPFFIQNTTAEVTGRGEYISPMRLNLNGLYLALVNPGIHVNTGWAFSQIRPSPFNPAFTNTLASVPEVWKEHGLWNDFEAHVSSQHPVIRQILHTFQDNGAIYTSLTGTGSTCYGIFRHRPVFDADFVSSMKIVKVISL
jgi:4-diphosphocytidyl-2-C-methyl-D-erythritol kinase